MPIRINTGQYGAARVVPGSTKGGRAQTTSGSTGRAPTTLLSDRIKARAKQTTPKKITTKHVSVGRGGYTRYVVDGKEYGSKNTAEIAAAIPTQARGGEITETQESQPRGPGPKKYTVRGRTYDTRAQALAASRGVALEEYSTRGGTGVAHRVSKTAQAQAQAQAPAQVRSSSGRGIGGTNLFGKAIHGLIPGTITDPNKVLQTAKPTPPPELPDFTQGADRTGQRTVAKPPTISSTSLAGLSDRGSVATGASGASSGAAKAVSQAAAAARRSVATTGTPGKFDTAGVSARGDFQQNVGGGSVNTAAIQRQGGFEANVGRGSGDFSSPVQGRSVTASIRDREGISTDVGPQYQLEQLQVNQDLEGRAAAQSTAAHGIRADLPGRVAAQRLTEGRGQTRGRASTILTRGGARGLGGTPANTLGARRLVSGRTPATPVEGTQAGEAAAAQAGVQQRQGIRAEQDRQVLRNAATQDGAQTSDVRSAGARQTSRREALIGGTGGEISGGPGGAGGGQSVSPRNLSARQRRTQALNAELDEQRRGAEAGRQAERVSTLLGGAPGNEATRARARRAGQGAANRTRQGGRPPQRGNVPERVRARRTLLGGG